MQCKRTGPKPSHCVPNVDVYDLMVQILVLPSCMDPKLANLQYLAIKLLTKHVLKRHMAFTIGAGWGGVGAPSMNRGVRGPTLLFRSGLM